MKNTRRYIVLFFMLVIFTSMHHRELVANARGVGENVASDEKPEIIFELGDFGTTKLERNASGGYSGEIRIVSRYTLGATVVRCNLSPGAGGIDTLHHIIISWKGSNRVSRMKANALMIRKSSLRSTKIYYNRPFSRNCESKVKGTFSLGTVTIPKSVKKVYISTSGLQCYFNNRDYWLSLGELRGWEKTNW